MAQLVDVELGAGARTRHVMGPLLLQQLQPIESVVWSSAMYLTELAVYWWHFTTLNASMYIKDIKLSTLETAIGTGIIIF